MGFRCSWKGCAATVKARYADGFAFMQNCNGFKTGWYCRTHVDAIIDAGDDDDPPDPWLERMLDDVNDRLDAMTKARGAGEFSADESARYWALVCELEEIDHAIRDRERGAKP